jgi:hypothetical protein
VTTRCFPATYRVMYCSALAGICTPGSIYTVRSDQLVQNGTTEPDGTCFKAAGFSAGQACAVAGVSELLLLISGHLTVGDAPGRTTLSWLRGASHSNTLPLPIEQQNDSSVAHPLTPQNRSLVQVALDGDAACLAAASCCSVLGQATLWSLAAAMSRQAWAGSATPICTDQAGQQVLCEGVGPTPNGWACSSDHPTDPQEDPGVEAVAMCCSAHHCFRAHKGPFPPCTGALNGTWTQLQSTGKPLLPKTLAVSVVIPTGSPASPTCFSRASGPLSP